MPAYFESGVFNRRGAWHGLGNVWTPENENDVLTPALALELSGLNWEVDLEPITRKGNETGKFWTVRATDDQEFGVVGRQYQVIQNSEGFVYLDQLVDNGELEIETAIAIYGGKVVTILARKPEGISIAGDMYDRFIGFTNRHDGLGACKVFTCRERVVCANTQRIAVDEFKQSGRHWSIRHQGDTNLKLAEARAALELSFEEDEAYKVALENLATEKFTNDSYNSALRNILDIDSIDKDKQPRKHRTAMQTRNAIHDILKNTEDLDLIRTRKLGLFQAVSQWETHNRKFRNDATKFQSLAVEGGELTNRAFAVLTA